MKLDDILDRLDGVVTAGNDRYMALCPAHPDRNPSLSIAYREGRILFYCFAGCSFDSIRRALISGIRIGPTSFAPRAGAKHPPRQAEVTAIYNYCDPNGNLMYQVLRYEPKTFRQRRPDGHGWWIWNLDGVKRIPYKLEEWADKYPKPLYLVEGEKDVEAIKKIGVVATTTGGATSWNPDMASYFDWREVVIIPDNDESGFQYAEAVAQSLKSRSALVTILQLPDLPDGGDVSDWIATAGPNPALKLAQLVESLGQRYCGPGE